MDRPRRPAGRSQSGVTLVELMVALILGLLISAAAIAALIVARQGFSNVNEVARMRETSRFAASLIQRIAVEGGFENAAYGDISATGAKPPGIRGWDNAILNVGILPADQAHNSRNGGCADTSCTNGSDILVVRFKGVSRAGGADGSMINCSGVAEPETMDRAWSIFHVTKSTAGEPTLACTYLDPATLTWKTEPLAQGVEALQVLYGVDTLTAVGVPGQDSVPDRYMRAADVDALGATAWSQVRELRIGLVMRGQSNSAVSKSASAETIPVLGPGFTSAADPLSNLVTPEDGRLRQKLIFTVHLRNAQFAP